MPNWKKVITSGSNAHLNQLTASNFQFTGTGTAELEVEGHITASGNISSSGRIAADGLDINGGSIFADDIMVNEGKSIFFDSQYTFIKSNTSNPEDLLIAANDDIVLMPDDDLIIQAGTTTHTTFFGEGKARIGSTSTSAPTSILEVGGDITTTHITASGNISASGNIINTGNIDSAGDATFGTITMTGKIDTSGEVEAEHLHSTDDIEVGDSIFHSGDTDTKIVFTGDVITFTAGNEQLLQLSEGGQDQVIIGDGGDVDFHVKGGGSNTLFVQGSSQKVGIGTNTPTKKLQVEGSISASGAINTLSHITASGNISASGTSHRFGGDMRFLGDTSGRDILFDASENTMKFLDNVNLNIGTGPSSTLGDMTLSSDGSGGLIRGTVGPLTVQTTGGKTILQNSAPAGKTEIIMDKEAGGAANTGEVLISGSATGGVRLNVMGNITASGNIVASGSYYGSGSYLTIANDNKTIPSEIRLNCEANTHYIGIRGPVHSGASSYVLKLPNSAPSDNQILKVNGSPSGGEVTLAWESDGGGGGGGVSFPTTEVVSSSNALFIGKTDGAFVSASTGNVQISGSGRGQLQVDYRLFDTGSSHLSSDGGAIGDIIKFGGSSTNAGDIYYLQTAGTWALARANAVGTSTGSLAVALGSNSTTDGMLLKGMVKLDNDPSATIGNPVFLDDTAAGHARNTAPDSGGDVVRIVGYYYSGSGLIYFNPDNTFIEVAS